MFEFVFQNHIVPVSLKTGNRREKLAWLCPKVTVKTTLKMPFKKDVYVSDYFLGCDQLPGNQWENKKNRQLLVTHL